MQNHASPVPPRREFLYQLAALAPLLALGISARAGEPSSPASSDNAAKLDTHHKQGPLQPPPTAAQLKAHEDLMAIPGIHMHGAEQIALLIYPGFTALDLVAPHYFFACLMGAKVHLVTTGPDLTPVASDLGLAIVPTCTFADCPADLDVLFIPGGTHGTLATARDPAALAFVRDRAARTRYLASVCTGAFVYGAAGLLRGKRATSHWIVRESLPAFGATPVDERVVWDGNLVSGAGVTAGIDLGLALVERLRSLPYAEALMLQAEYSPAPPFPFVTPQTANPALTDALYQMCAPLRDGAAEIGAQLPPAS
jgi:putative intracellular protease/amidase